MVWVSPPNSEKFYVMGWIKKLSLKFKLLVVLVSVTATMLLVYAVLALNDFKSDKIAYVYDTNVSNARSLSQQINSEITFLAEKMRFFLRGYSHSDHSFHPYMKKMFAEDPYLKQLKAYQKDRESGQYNSVTDMTNTEAKSQVKKEIRSLDEQLVQEALESEVSLRLLESAPNQWLLAVKFPQAGGRDPLVTLGLVSRGTFLKDFSRAQLQDTYLLNHEQEVMVRPRKASYDLEEQQLVSMLKDRLQSSGLTGMTFEGTSRAGKKWLYSVVGVSWGDMRVVSVVPKEVALQGVYLLAVKSVIFLVLLICVTVFVSVVSSNRLTASLQKLRQATKKISQGDFDLKVPVDSSDEVGQVSEGFNQMTEEIKRLMEETAEKARMEGELQTARVVQTTLFPEGEFHGENIDIQGYYTPASECGGDWWYYNEIGDKMFLWIGDATGHGVPAALVTSAAKSASQIIESYPGIQVHEAMSLLNRAIYHTAKGNVLMTFFLGAFDSNTGELSYCNASHDPPLLLPYKEDKLKRKDIKPLMENRGPRLGESLESQYEASTVALNPGDRLFFYTDGVTELKNAQGEMWGERKMVRTILSTFNSGESSVDAFVSDLNSEIDKYREGAELEDDITYFWMHYRGPAAQKVS